MLCLVPLADLCTRALPGDLQQHSGLLHPAPPHNCCLQQQCTGRNGAYIAYSFYCCRLHARGDPTDAGCPSPAMQQPASCM